MSTEHEDPSPGHDTTITIIVNGREKQVSTRDLSFLEIVRLAFPGNGPLNETTAYTVTFKKADGSKTEGSLVAGDSVEIKNGTIFNVTATDRS
jgi:hypothetical protein